jgi:hypothetical protein
MRILRRLARTVIPGVCPYCRGAEGGCADCNGQGWINI